MFDISFVFFICTLHVKFQKKKKKMHACKAAAAWPLMEVAYTDPIFSVMALHDHRLY